MMKRWLGLRLVFVFILGITSLSTCIADDRCCAHCGCKQPKKTLKLVKEDKKISVTCWGVQEVDFCVNGPSCPGCTHCETICKKDPSNKADAIVCSESKSFQWKDWIPKANASIATKKKLMKKTVTKTIPSFRWVIEDLCDQCKAESNANK